MNIRIPELSLVALVGASGAGKSTFAKKHFKETEVISSDYCRGLVSDDQNSMDASDDAFDVIHYIAAKRLRRGKLTVVDATNVQPEARRPLISLAREYHCLPVAIVLNMPPKLCAERNEQRPDRNFGPHVVRLHARQLKRSLKLLKREGFRHIYVLNSPEEVESVTIVREPLWNDKRDEHGPFDIVGDIHGCFEELSQLLTELGYQVNREESGEHEEYSATHPEGRKAVFLGDLVDRGPQIPQVLKLVMSMVEAGNGICIPGNHDVKLYKKLSGKKVQVKHGLAETIAQLEKEPEDFVEKVKKFLNSLISHYVLDGGKLVVAHAGLREEMQGRASKVVRDFCLYGETTGETDEFGLPVRYNWASEYRGNAIVVYGHTPVLEPEWLNKTINIDSGCVFGGKLTALRYPELEIVSVPARKTYCEPAKPIAEPIDAGGLSAQQVHDDVLSIDDVLGKRVISTHLQANITIREENAAAAVEILSRFAVNPKWLIYLPPTMSPSSTSNLPDLLEHPTEAFQYYQTRGVETVICEEKHMGSRAIVIVGKDEEAITKRFGITGKGIGICYTRTGREFFNDKILKAEFLEKIRDALSKTGFWEKSESDWVCLDCELMPWSIKAQALLKEQYAAVGASATAALPEAIKTLGTAKLRGIETDELLLLYRERKDMAHQFVKAYRNYCWPVNSLNDLRLAPFHILASEGKTYVDKNHYWHMENIHELCKGDKNLLLATPYKQINFADESSVEAGIEWWEDLTRRGGEGMVVKPYDFIVKGKSEILQPAIKCRGKEYLRIIYGPEYTMVENLKALKNRGLAKKRSLAIREFALGIEALNRFVKKEPLRRVHECVLGVLALESVPVDPRL